DNLNDLYVAFTRAEDVLIGYCTTPKGDPYKDSDTKAFSSMLPIFYAGTGRDRGDADFSQMVSGELTEQNNTSDAKKDATVQDAGNETDIEISPVEKMKTFRLRSDGFDNESTEQGKRMHMVMEKITTPADLDSVLQEMLFKGHIDNSQHDSMKPELERFIHNPDAASWFDGSQRLLTERTIIDVSQNPDGSERKTIRRPDRVMIDRESGAVTIVDYKFGEEKQAEHIKQVQHYVKLYKKAGHTDVTGYLYYSKDLEIVKV
ncbi:MAG: PD-(D/E)XK nuclease family protein, partial [Paludibacteraceae bacterium]|nr:PD-(D/E)XK nuclease family protein [Paludibacteraceae bacterium]